MSSFFFFFESFDFLCFCFFFLLLASSSSLWTNPLSLPFQLKIPEKQNLTHQCPRTCSSRGGSEGLSTESLRIERTRKRGEKREREKERGEKQQQFVPLTSLVLVRSFHSFDYCAEGGRREREREGERTTWIGGSCKETERESSASRFFIFHFFSFFLERDVSLEKEGLRSPPPLFLAAASVPFPTT